MCVCFSILITFLQLRNIQKRTHPSYLYCPGKNFIKEDPLTKKTSGHSCSRKNHSTLTQSIQAGIAPENSTNDFFLMLSLWKLDQFQDTWHFWNLFLPLSQLWFHINQKDYALHLLLECHILYGQDYTPTMGTWDWWLTHMVIYWPSQLWQHWHKLQLHVIPFQFPSS